MRCCAKPDALALVALCLNRSCATRPCRYAQLRAIKSVCRREYVCGSEHPAQTDVLAHEMVMERSGDVQDDKPGHQEAEYFVPFVRGLGQR